MKLQFKKASKSLAKAKIALTGPSGSGKTLSALMLAKGLTNNGKVAVIDTENNSASLYEDRFHNWEYFVLPMNPPYTVEKYLMGLEAAKDQGFDCVIIDSLSHVWAAEGGLLQQKEALDSRGGNSYTNWGSITKLYEKLKSELLHAPIHTICTMRSKQEYVMEQNDKGKSAPKKVGLAPIMRDGMEYEFTLVFDIGMDHQFMVSKDRTGLFNNVVDTISTKTGETIKDWLYSAPTPPPQESPPDTAQNNEAQWSSNPQNEPQPDPHDQGNGDKTWDSITNEDFTPQTSQDHYAKQSPPEIPQKTSPLPSNPAPVQSKAPTPTQSKGILTDDMYERLRKPDESLADCKKRLSTKSTPLPPQSPKKVINHAPGMHNYAENPQDFTFPLGKYKGKSLNEVDSGELINYLEYLHNNSGGKELTGWAKDFEVAFNAM